MTDTRDTLIGRLSDYRLYFYVQRLPANVRQLRYYYISIDI